MVVLVVAMVAPVAWGLRSATLPPSQGRAAINVIQGSWPDFHASYREQPAPWAKARQAAIAREVEQGDLRSVAERVQANPLHYARWYASKPAALWGWDIQLGAGGIYFLGTELSPYDGPAWDAMQTAYHALNPWLTLLTLGYALLLLRSRDPVALLCGGAVWYLTALHVVFQAEPRYAIAYRPIECVLVAGALWRLLAIRTTWSLVGSAARTAH
jgi:hypothetical protein